MSLSFNVHDRDHLHRFCGIKGGLISREYCVHVCPERGAQKCSRPWLRSH